ncbi:hypothetical protein BC827DRAFT_1156479 [Russula dissimulans]|nr:hypothetical protein BC827DRAFT_1156479 [Russula dissimulans]
MTPLTPQPRKVSLSFIKASRASIERPELHGSRENPGPGNFSEEDDSEWLWEMKTTSSFAAPGPLATVTRMATWMKRVVWRGSGLQVQHSAMIAVSLVEEASAVPSFGNLAVLPAVGRPLICSGQQNYWCQVPHAWTEPVIVVSL